MRAKAVIPVSRATMTDAIAGIMRSTEEAVTAFFISDAHNGVSRTDNRLKTMLQSLVNRVINKKLRSIEFENRLLRKIERIAALTR